MCQKSKTVGIIAESALRRKAWFVNGKNAFDFLKQLSVLDHDM